VIVSGAHKATEMIFLKYHMHYYIICTLGDGKDVVVEVAFILKEYTLDCVTIATCCNKVIPSKIRSISSD